MNILIIDDEPIVLKDTSRVIEKALTEECANEPIKMYTCSNSNDAIKLINEVSFDIIFSDIDMPGMKGIELAKKIEKDGSSANIVFITGYPKYGIDAWETNASAFLLKPVMKNDIKEAIKKLRNPIKVNNNKLDITCFGAFEISYRGHRITFKRKKCLELLAVLVDAFGAEVSNEKIRCMLWEEEEDSKEKNAYVRILVKEIRDELNDAGIEDVVINTNGGYMIDKAKVNCDYFECAKKPNYVKPNTYMSQYQWANDN